MVKERANRFRETRGCGGGRCVINVHVDVDSSIESGSFDRLVYSFFSFSCASFTNLDVCLRPYVGARFTG